MNFFFVFSLEHDSLKSYSLNNNMDYIFFLSHIKFKLLIISVIAHNISMLVNFAIIETLKHNYDVHIILKICNKLTRDICFFFLTSLDIV